MSQALKNIPIATIGEICEIRSENGFPKHLQGKENGDYPFFKVGEISRNWQRGNILLRETEHHLTQKEAKSIKAKTLPAGAVVFAKIGAAVALNRRAILATESLVDNNVMGIIPGELVESKYAFYFMCTVDLGAKTRGGAVPSLRKEDIKEVKIPLPPLPPLPEQRRIVAKIEELFSKLDVGVDALKKAKAQLKRYRQSVLSAAVTGELTKDWREANPNTEPASELLKRILKQRREQWNGKGKYKEPIAPETTDLPDIPEHWTWATLPQLGELNRGKSKHRPRNAKFLYGGSYPFVQTGDIRHANGTIIKYSQTYNEAGLNQSRLWPRGTLCITIAANIAESSILGFDACFPDSIVGFIPTGEELDVRYYEFFMQTAREDLDRYAPATAQKNINLKILSEVAVPLPPLAEQNQIVAEVKARITAMDYLEAEINQQLIRSNRLRQSTLASAFLGGL